MFSILMELKYVFSEISVITIKTESLLSYFLFLKLSFPVANLVLLSVDFCFLLGDTDSTFIFSESLELDLVLLPLGLTVVQSIIIV